LDALEQAHLAERKQFFDGQLDAGMVAVGPLHLFGEAQKL
jgi:hypothetical protein